MLVSCVSFCPFICGIDLLENASGISIEEMSDSLGKKQHTRGEGSRSLGRLEQCPKNRFRYDIFSLIGYLVCESLSSSVRQRQWTFCLISDKIPGSCSCGTVEGKSKHHLRSERSTLTSLERYVESIICIYQVRKNLCSQCHIIYSSYHNHVDALHQN